MAWSGLHAQYSGMHELSTFRLALIFLAGLSVAGPTFADDAVIEAATARASGGDWTVAVTLRHGDTGWDDYADGWRVVDGDGTVLGTRTLFHPHVTEQPFTRSLSGLAIPGATVRVFIEARTNADGWGKAQFALDLAE